jgi:hypothetical protein
MCLPSLFRSGNFAGQPLFGYLAGRESRNPFREAVNAALSSI